MKKMFFSVLFVMALFCQVSDAKMMGLEGNDYTYIVQVGIYCQNSYSFESDILNINKNINKIGKNGLEIASEDDPIYYQVRNTYVIMSPLRITTIYSQPAESKGSDGQPETRVCVGLETK